MLKIVFDLTQFEEVELIPIADVHIGSPLCDISSLHETISYVLKEPENVNRARICLLNGDLTESVTRKSVGNIFDMTMTPQLQVATMIEMLKPLAQPSEKYPMGKILSYCGGNHDVDRYKDTGITSAESIACGLGLEDRYSSDGCYSFIELQKIQSPKDKTSVTCYNTHLTGSGHSTGAKANRISKLSAGILADLFVGSHYHNPMTFKEDIIVPNSNKHALVQKTMTYVISNCFMRYGDYAQRAGMKPASIVVPKIIIKQKRIGAKSERLTTIEVVL